MAIFRKPLSQPFLSTPPRPHLTRAAKAKESRLHDEELVPKQSARLAVKSKHREPKPEAQCRKVMMKRLGMQTETQLPDEASFDEFQTEFKLPLSSETRETMEVLFLGKRRRAHRAARTALVLRWIGRTTPSYHDNREGVYLECAWPE